MPKPPIIKINDIPGYLKMFVLLWLAVAFLAVNEDSAFAKNQPPSSIAQNLYQSARKDLLQLRILTKNGRTQIALGSGFLVGKTSLVITNYHVVSKIALKPDKYLGEFLDVDGKSGPLELLSVDVLNDLAVVRISRTGSGFFSVPEKPSSLKQGEHLFSLGNPLDLGFAISEGSYNGIIRRSFYDEFLFTGPINPGMSGGPCITADGLLAGVNVSHRTDGELVSFIVPTKYVHALLKMATTSKAPAKDFYGVVGQQLLTHQVLMIDKVLESPFTLRSMGLYKAPVRESDQMRCWGKSSEKGKLLYSQEDIDCSMESDIFVANNLRTGTVSIRHQYTKSTQLGSLRFSQLASKSVKDEKFGDHKDQNLTAPKCAEQFVGNGKLPMRAVVCVRAYKKFAGLYDFSVLIDTVDEPLMNLESRLDARGVSYDNGLRISRIFLESIGREKKP